MQKKYFIDGCFDGYHYGHANAIFQSRQISDILVLGTHSDEEMNEFKNKPLFKYEERFFMLKHCKYIDRLIEYVPYVTTFETVAKYDCLAFLHGDETTVTKNNKPAIDANIIDNNYITYDVTRGISTSNLLLRFYYYINNMPIITNPDTEYLQNMFDKLDNYNKKLKTESNSKNLYLYHSWDLLCSIHVKHILKIKELYPNYVINVCFSNDENDKFIYNKLERAITLCSIDLIDNVIINNDLYEYNNEHAININLYDKSNKFYLDFDKKSYIFSIMKNIKDYETKLNKELDKCVKLLDNIGFL